MCSPTSYMDDSLWLVENLGGGDCLLYSFLGPIFATAGMTDRYLRGKQQYVIWFRQKLNKFCRKMKMSDEDKRDVNRELSRPHEAIVTTLLPYIGLCCNLSIVLLLTTDKNENGMIKFENPKAKYWIIIYYSNNHYRSVVQKDGNSYTSLYLEDTLLKINPINIINHGQYVPFPLRNNVLNEDKAYHST